MRTDDAKWHEMAENDANTVGRQSGGVAEWRGGGMRLTLPPIAADFYNKVSYGERPA